MKSQPHLQNNILHLHRHKQSVQSLLYSNGLRSVWIIKHDADRFISGIFYALHPRMFFCNMISVGCRIPPLYFIGAHIYEAINLECLGSQAQLIGYSNLPLRLFEFFLKAKNRSFLQKSTRHISKQHLFWYTSINFPSS